MDRAPVTVPLATGTKVVDALIPVGRGQRELILGDRQTGKDRHRRRLHAQSEGQGRHLHLLRHRPAQLFGGQASSPICATATRMAYSIVVVASGDAPAGQQFVAPYAAMSMGEYFMRSGRDVLVVFDDLSRHARAYRELSLLLRRPPGRESFPGDIFYIHSRLLERSTHLRKNVGRRLAHRRCPSSKPKSRTWPPTFPPT